MKRVSYSELSPYSEPHFAYSECDHMREKGILDTGQGEKLHGSVRLMF